MNALLSTDGSNWLDAAISAISGWVLNTGIKIVISLVLMLISFRIIKRISRKIEKKGENGKHDKTIMKTLAYVFNIGAKTLVLVCLIGYLGIDTSGITALIASLGVCIGLAVNGAVSNLAGGVIILVTRPFKVDDYIEAQGVSGTVEDIHMICTKIRTPDNKVIYIPNGALANNNIINYSEKDTRRVDFKFSIAYDSDYAKAKQLVWDIITSHELTLDDPAPFVRMSEHGDSAIAITARVWVNSGDYWTVNFDVLEAVKKAFDENGIEIPFNQLDVHVKNN
ncbi:MAG: mechanosensitive ion channel [Ruminococcaceae bacterium]|nr:mechanosensitive ion channel [Oscillospiraceae bacterium]